MKYTIYLLSIVLLFVSCNKDYIEIKRGEKPFKGEKNEIVYLKDTTLTIIEKQTGFRESNFYIKNPDSSYFLFNFCKSDCNEKIQIFKFERQYFAFLITNSTRFSTKNRILLFKIIDDKPVKLIDNIDKVYKTFRFEKDKFIYVLENGVEKSIDLN